MRQKEITLTLKVYYRKDEKYNKKFKALKIENFEMMSILNRCTLRCTTIKFIALLIIPQDDHIYKMKTHYTAVRWIFYGFEKKKKHNIFIGQMCDKYKYNIRIYKIECSMLHIAI
jgi:hypothetical protein